MGDKSTSLILTTQIINTLFVEIRQNTLNQYFKSENTCGNLTFENCLIIFYDAKIS